MYVYIFLLIYLFCFVLFCLCLCIHSGGETAEEVSKETRGPLHLTLTASSSFRVYKGGVILIFIAAFISVCLVYLYLLRIQ